jgi:hypothetical protein
LSIQKVEIVSPAPAKKKAWGVLLQTLTGLGIRTLLVYWFFSSWFSELGLTYWGLVLPVYIAMFIFRGPTARVIPERYLRRRKWLNLDGELVEELEEVSNKVK